MAATRGRRVMNAAEYIRREVLGLTQQELADVVGFLTVRSVYELETADEDRLTLEQIRLLRAYARQKRIEWPDELLNDLVAKRVKAVTTPRRRGRPKT